MHGITRLDAGLRDAVHNTSEQGTASDALPKSSDMSSYPTQNRPYASCAVSKCGMVAAS